ncbi:tyrosine-type recombinase/integrase [Bacteroides caecicola]|uniref:Tyrosine-type recombinase/integrase n=1 Tax=Bacteroides caecicola TaxID=1462569 RepID=A0ABS2F6A5_9BACE|nr:tyrosine-type recombinase/integrase [Bacteroides caecicola]
MVTETAQYSALHCFFNFKQNDEYLLISNTLRFICSILLAIAFYFILHLARHSYAVIQISLGTDIYTVSKMLTHKNVSTTQIYADLVNSKKRETANKISLK